MKKTLKPISHQEFTERAQRGMNRAAKKAPKTPEWGPEAQKRWQEGQKEALKYRKAFENNRD